MSFKQAKFNQMPEDVVDDASIDRQLLTPSLLYLNFKDKLAIYRPWCIEVLVLKCFCLMLNRKKTVPELGHSLKHLLLTRESLLSNVFSL